MNGLFVCLKLRIFLARCKSLAHLSSAFSTLYLGLCLALFGRRCGRLGWFMFPLGVQGILGSTLVHSNKGIDFEFALAAIEIHETNLTKDLPFCPSLIVKSKDGP